MPTAATIDDWYMPEPNSGCWIWIGNLDREGYGKFRGTSAHRFFYERAFGELPPKPLVLDHKCRVRCCVNPLHLEPVTIKENARRGMVGTKTHCVNGHELVGLALYIMPNGNRACRLCRRLFGREWKRKRRQVERRL